MLISYNPNINKIIEAIILILKIHGDARNIFILKSLYYADKFHLQNYGRPITGDTFFKLQYGPVGTKAYDLLKLNEITFSKDVLDHVQNSFVSRMKNGWPIYHALREPDLDAFSDSDEFCLRKAVEYCIQLSNKNNKAFYKDFSLSEESHKERAWLDAEMQKPLDFIKMIDDDTPNRDDLIEYMAETCCSVSI